MVRMATAAWLAGMVSLSAAQTTELALTLAAGERAWTTVAAGDARVTWSGSGPTTEVTLTNGAGVVGRLDPTPTGLVDISLAVSAEGASELRVQFTDDPARAPVSALWTAEVSGAKAQRLAARLAPPAPAESPLYLYVGAKGDGTLRLSALALVSEALPPRLEAGPPPALPDGWEPAGYLDAQAREVAGATELLIEINGLQLSIEPETSCVLGGFAPLSAFILARGNTPRKLTLEGEFPAGIACDPREFSITKGGTSRAHLRVQGLLPGTHTGRVTARSGRESASFPLRVTVTRGYPSFGAAAGEPAGARRWQLREVVVRATPTSTLPELLDQAQPILTSGSGMFVVFFDGLPAHEVLRAFVEAVKGRVNLYGAAARPLRPYVGQAPEGEAEGLLTAARELQTVVSALDPDAACVSPIFDDTANAEGTPENRLLEACLSRGLKRYIAALVATAAPLPSGGVLGELRSGANAREAGAFWTQLDAQASLDGLETLMDKHDSALPILTSSIGGPAGADERLDALKAARAMVIASYAGATGATFAESPAGGRISLTRADGSLSPTGWAVQELGRELAGAVPMFRTWREADAPGGPGSATVALPFLRGDEALLVLWNNTSVAQPLTLTLRQVPYSEHVLSLTRDDPFVRRTYAGLFEFSKRAMQARRQDVYLTVAPLEIKVLRYRMQLALPTWIDSLVYTPRVKTAPPTAERDDRPWWQQLQDWAEGVR